MTGEKTEPAGPPDVSRLRLGITTFAEETQRRRWRMAVVILIGTAGIGFVALRRPVEKIYEVQPTSVTSASVAEAAFGQPTGTATASPPATTPAASATTSATPARSNLAAPATKPAPKKAKARTPDRLEVEDFRRRPPTLDTTPINDPSELSRTM